MRSFFGVVGCVLLAASLAFGQNIYGTLNGTTLDSSGAAVPGAKGTLVDQAKGGERTFSSGPDGSFVIPNIAPGTYTVSIQSDGFKKLSLRDIVLTAGENRSLGRLVLEVGGVVESVTVEAEATPVQVSSGERSGLVTGQQLNDIAVRGRDFASFLATVPGIVDTASQGREAMARNALGSIHINGGRSTSALMMVDGMPSMDAGNNGVPNEPNMDAIAEVKVLTSNHQAEYGRNGGGTITIITKSGSKDFHGSAYEHYRHESLNANTFFNNRSATPKPAYRYRITGYSIGGPVIIPKANFNRNKDKLFFFFSQELVGSRNSTTQFMNTPTELERNGDFSKSFDVSGKLIPVKDPTTGKAFPGNVIPKDRINALGQSMLNFLPLPNYTDPDPDNVYRRNFRTQDSGTWPRRQEVLRVDYNVTPSFQVFYRLLQDYNRRELLSGSGGWPAGGVNYLLSPVIWDRPARAQAVHATNIISPTLVNEVTFTRTFNNVITYPTNPSVLDRSLMGNPAQWFKDDKPSSNWIPGLTFGSLPVNTANTSLSATLPDELPNPAYNVTESLSKVWRNHTFKAGIYVERNNKLQAASSNIRGSFNFARNTNNPLDSGNGYSNALLGVFNQYSEATSQPRGDYLFWNVEWYVQDNWRITKKLTLDYGLRLSHTPSTIDRGGALATFVPGLYDPAAAPTLYMPALDSAKKRVAKDPLTGALAPNPLIGLFVPNSGDYANGSRRGGEDGVPKGLYSTPWLGWGPRFGFAYDVFGNGRTAIRGGFGMFIDKIQGNTIYDTAANPPVTYESNLFFGTLDTYAQSSGVVGPSGITAFSGHHPITSVMNYSLSIQQRLKDTVLDVAYVSSLGRHLSVQRNINAIPMYARFDPKNADPTQPTKPLQDNFLRPYKGYGNINMREFTGTSNYHSLQVSANRRMAKGLQFGVSYTWSKTLTVASGDNGGLSSYFATRSWNYGPASFDQPHTFVLNYTYDIPKVGTKTGFRPAKWVLDNWQVSGITSFTSGSPFTPSFGTVDGQDITGSTDGARITVIGNPRLDKSQKTFDRVFNTDVFVRTPQGSFGNAGVGMLYGPGMNNWDFAITKRFPLFSEGRYVQFRTELFNAWNHTQFDGVDSSAQFDVNGVQTDPKFGSYTSTLRPRNIQLSLRLVF